MRGKSSLAKCCRVVGVAALILIIVSLALEINHDKALAQMFECKAAGCVECGYFRTAALFLLVAIILCCILVAQIAVSIYNGCDYLRVLYSASAFQAVAVLSFLFSWCACVSAIIVYMIGEAKQYRVQFPNFGNIISSMSNNLSENSVCDEIKHGIFGAAALLSFAGVVLGIIGYASLVLGDDNKSEFHTKSTSSDFEA